jgi:TM2 domain-containing membrane protein YozV
MAKRPTPSEKPKAFSPDFNYLLAVVFSWLVPGAGHWIIGRPIRGLAMFFLLVGSFWWGEWISSGYAVTRVEHPIFFYAQVGNGLSALLADKIQFGDLPPRVPPQHRQEIDRQIPPQITMGILITSVSGLLNVLLVLFIMDPRSWEAAQAAAMAAGARAGGGST